VPLVAASLMVFLGIAASQRVLSALGEVQNTRIRELAQLRIESLSVALGPHVLRENVWEIYDTLVRATGEAGKGRLVFTAVADENGDILAATDPVRAPIGEPLAPVNEQTQELSNLSISNDTSQISLLTPLIYQGRSVGQILTELDVGDLISERVRTTRVLVIANALATLLLSVFGYLATRRMLKPITLMVNHMRESADAPETIPDSELPPGDSEMAQLIRSYNTMANAVEAKAETDRRMAERERFVSLGRLSSSLAHEINNPLGGLLNAADTIRAYPDRPDVVKNSADLLTRGLSHLRDIARVTLDQNRLDRSGEPMSLDDLDDLKMLISPEIARNTQSLDWDIAADDAATSAYSAAPVRQIVLNMLLNASAAAGKNGRVGMQVYARGDDLCLRFSDSGQGLSNIAKERLMGTGPAPPGGGVGLRLVRDLVGEFDGAIKSERSDGMTTIDITLPFPTEQGDASC